MLILTRKINQKILISSNIEVTVIEIRGDQVKIGVQAPKDIKVFREEVYEEIQKENRAAMLSSEQLDLPDLQLGVFD